MAKQDFITQVEGQKMWTYVAYSSVILFGALIVLAVKESINTNDLKAEKDSAVEDLKNSEQSIEKTAMALGLGVNEEHSECGGCSQT